MVIDDASPDGTQDVVKQLQREFGEDKCAGGLKGAVWRAALLQQGRPLRLPPTLTAPSTPLPAPAGSCCGHGRASWGWALHTCMA